ncbi:TPA: hypothetical protein ACXJF7_006445, partial [Burkholderia sola]
MDRKSCVPGGTAGSLLRDLFGVSGYFPGYRENSGLPGKNLPTGKNVDYTVSAGPSGRSCGARPVPAAGADPRDDHPRGGSPARQCCAPAAAGAAVPAGGTSVTKPIRVS